MKDKAKNREIGNLGEDLACKFLMKQGYSIKERNYWKKFGELDIVATKGGKLHFVEVKSVSCPTNMWRAGVTFADSLTAEHRPEDNVHPAKLVRLSRTIQAYLMEKDVSSETNWQFDIITVHINMTDKTAKIEILEDIVIS